MLKYRASVKVLLFHLCAGRYRIDARSTAKSRQLLPFIGLYINTILTFCKEVFKNFFKLFYFYIANDTFSKKSVDFSLLYMVE